MRVRLSHHTAYAYHEPVRFRTHRLMVRPREGHDVHIESSVLRITPSHSVSWVRDVNGNCIALVDFPGASDRLDFLSELVLDLYNTNPLDFILEESAYRYPFSYAPEVAADLEPCLRLLYPDEAEDLRRWGRQFWSEGETIETVSLLQRVNLFIVKNFEYVRREAKGVQNPVETLEKKSGSCRDFAALMLELCRSWGLGARFVSGYMLAGGDEPAGSSTHAWIEVYLPGAGWKGFDPTTGLVAGALHIAVAVARDPRTIPPIAGSYIGPATAFKNIHVDVRVEKLSDLSTPSLSSLVHPQPGFSLAAVEPAQPSNTRII